MASKAVAEKLITAEQLATMRIDYPCELGEGRIVRLSPTSWTHARVVANVLELLVPYAKRKKLGKVTSADGGYHVRRKPDSVRCPDVAFLSRETMARADAAGGTFARVAPDLAVEVLSPKDPWVEIETKVGEYLDAGSKLVWIVNPKAETVHVYEPGKDVRVLSTKDKIEGGKALPGFKAPVKAFFAR